MYAGLTQLFDPSRNPPKSAHPPKSSLNLGLHGERDGCFTKVLTLVQFDRVRNIEADVPLIHVLISSARGAGYM